ncbi:hypothetical protein QAD02_015937 [Eretmocerus hayati]|uniref:Uncharacterized protein n=1 Tax=Eretmocerus hayati TaxID=131215 RepID=A0ACC2P9S6_9HYME|nr:hypothetical protein QAD02_015937 [Eretmocerus hayati]
MLSLLAILFVCGAIEANPPKPINGVKLNKGDAKIEDYAYLVSFQLDTKKFCSGVIITANHLLTTAQCASSVNANVKIIRAGSNSYLQDGDLYTVAKTINHEAYDEKKLVNNIAVVQVVENFSGITKDIVVNSDGAYIQPSKEGTAVGYGRLSTNHSKDLIDAVDVQVIDGKKCTYRALNAGEFCVKNLRESKGTCYIPGSPIVRMIGSNMAVLGMVSMRDEDCENTSDVFVDVSNFKNWIDTVTSK